MKNVKRLCCLLTLLSFALLPGCGKSQDGDVVYDFGGTLERDGEQIDILTSHDRKAIYIYYDDEECKLLDKAKLPTKELKDADWEVTWVDTSDLNGDNNGDLQVMLHHADTSESCLVWTWDKDKGYVYQSDDSWLYQISIINNGYMGDAALYRLVGCWFCPIVDLYSFIQFDVYGNWKLYYGEGGLADEGNLRYAPKEEVYYFCSSVGGPMDGSTMEVDHETIVTSTGYIFGFSRYSPYEGLWLCESTENCDYLEFDSSGNWQLRLEGDVIDEGYIWYSEDMGQSFWICSDRDSAVNGSGLGDVDRNGQLWFSEYGCFNRVNETEEQGNDADETEEYYGWNPDLYQRYVSEFEGTWYYDDDLSATTYIVIDGEGNWSYYERVSGDAEGTEMDYGTLGYSADEASTYYANSALYDGLSIRVFEFDEDVIIWNDEYTYYRME